MTSIILSPSLGLFPKGIPASRTRTKVSMQLVLRYQLPNIEWCFLEMPFLCSWVIVNSSLWYNGDTYWLKFIIAGKYCRLLRVQIWSNQWWRSHLCLRQYPPCWCRGKESRASSSVVNWYPSTRCLSFEACLRNLTCPSVHLHLFNLRACSFFPSSKRPT